MLFVLRNGFPVPGARDLVRQDRVISGFRDPAAVPFVGQRLLDLDGLDALIDPGLGIAFLPIEGHSAVNDKLRVRDLVDPLPSDFCQPQLKGLGLFGRNGLDQAKDSLCIRSGDLSCLSISCNHFNRGTNCTPLGI